MRDQYVGDIGDLGKYALLRALAASSADENARFRLGVAWYRTPDQPLARSDTAHLTELKAKDRTLDPALFDELKRVVSADGTLDEVARSSILPNDTIYYSEPVPSALLKRHEWVANAVNALREADLVFLDPDVGLQTSPKGNISKAHATYEEVEKLARSGQSVVIYQHLDRTGAVQQASTCLRALEMRALHSSPFALRFRPMRLFFVVPNEKHASALRARACRLVEGGWSSRFTLVSTSQSIRRGTYVVSPDRSLLDIPRIHAFLTRSYWAEGVSPETVRRSIENSISFGLYCGKEQIGFARAITDKATFAYLADVYIEEPYRGRGLSKMLLEAVLSHPELRGVRRWILGTRDAHALYRKFGFGEPRRPERWMEKWDAALYKYEGST